jgi:dihydrofolate synthase/folylpolyglutamate synthase
LGVRKEKSRQDDIFDDVISEEELTRLIAGNRSSLESCQQDAALGKITFFEVLTALAFVYFKQMKTDFVVLETGLGGRLDATNAADSLIAAIAPISLEHTHLLGDTLEKIAGEKMAIIKDPLQKVVLAPQESHVMNLLKERCRQFGIMPVVVGEDMTYELLALSPEGQICTIRTPRAVYAKLQTALLGEHQACNAAVAVGIIEQLKGLGYAISTESIYSGLKETFWPLRFEKLGGPEHIILDGAHTASSSQALAEAILKTYPDRRVTMIVGFTMEKDIQGMCRQFNRIADKIIATQSRHPRSFCFDEKDLRSHFPDKPCLTAPSIEEALKIARKDLTPDDILLISGSLYLVSEARKLCIN